MYRIGLTLSGGGAKGLAHAGVLKALEEYGFVVKKVKLLKHHTDVTAVNVDVNLLVGNIGAVENDASRSGVLHTVEATQKGTLAAT